ATAAPSPGGCEIKHLQPVAGPPTGPCRSSIQVISDSRDNRVAVRRASRCDARDGLRDAGEDLCSHDMILACPACDSRYDVTGHTVGQQFRCRCGGMMTLPAMPPSAGELACPHCGAGVAATASACAHCSAELLVKACPRCLSRVFHGHRHCPECGAELAIAATADADRARPCPRCAAALHARRIGDIVIDECAACLGVFLDHVAIKRVVVDLAQSRAEPLL